jgi:hypothetical protein
LSRLAPSFVIGYHGCEKAEGESAISRNTPLRKSDQKHDWLGAGTYFWESDFQRATEWADYKAVNGLCKVPFVVGAIIDLGNCFDLTLRANLDLLARAYADFSTAYKAASLPMPENKDSPKIKTQNRVIRTLDCAILNYVHTTNENAGLAPFDTVRGVFVEGDPVYPGSEIYRKTHIQIAVRNRACIKAIFLPQ